MTYPQYTNQYFPSYEWIKFRIEKNCLSTQNRSILKSIQENESVFIHVRRGDFFSEEYKNLFEGTCPIDYYEKSIDYICSHISSPSFYVFSDDIKWSKDNLPLKEKKVFFVDWNKGHDSPIDMFLMSQCKYAIMANSTFSYWGAYLGRHKKYVFYPSKWMNNYPTPDIFKKEWINF